MAKDIPFRVTVKASIEVNMEIEMNTCDSFDNARTLGVSAIEQWLKDTVVNHRSKDDWPNPKCLIGDVEAVRVSGTWLKPSE